VIFTPGKGLSTGPWLATVTLVSGFTTDTASATVEFISPSTASGLSGLPTLLAGGGVTAVLFLIAFVLIRRTRRVSRVHA
jgi:hypothetical protein